MATPVTSVKEALLSAWVGTLQLCHDQGKTQGRHPHPTVLTHWNCKSLELVWCTHSQEHNTVPDVYAGALVTCERDGGPEHCQCSNAPMRALNMQETSGRPRHPHIFSPEGNS